MTKDLISHLRKAAKHSYLGRLLLEEAADCIEGLQAENDKLNAAIKRQSGAAKTLRASIMAEVQHLKDMDRGEYFASKSLDSEREANSILTAERDAWKARAEAAEAALTRAYERGRDDAVQIALNKADANHLGPCGGAYLNAASAIRALTPPADLAVNTGDN